MRKAALVRGGAARVARTLRDRVLPVPASERTARACVERRRSRRTRRARHQGLRREGETIVAPKTKNAVRDVPIEPALAPLLERMRPKRPGKTAVLVAPLLAQWNEQRRAKMLRSQLTLAGVKRARLTEDSSGAAGVPFAPSPRSLGSFAGSNRIRAKHWAKWPVTKRKIPSNQCRRRESKPPPFDANTLQYQRIVPERPDPWAQPATQRPVPIPPRWWSPSASPPMRRGGAPEAAGRCPRDAAS